ncbi:bacteriocin secretion accessory protein [Companilactobacillus huachuanensis]|uniref:Bacteriocin secretion accessory protein n=1 Tax=Companilactobacillus huachuanensis TaxID=2559914 RepID=A0ABW1RMP5_9LACO|nr:bacteriocin secretion accessory protein [Companilactobacillus huachuanensis]
MDKKFLESSEFYNKRFNNFSTLLIVPISILFVLLVLFTCFMKREVTIESFGELGSRNSIPIVQSSSNSAIKNNYLSEGKYVKKGQILVTFKNTSNTIKLDALNEQKVNVDDQIKGLETFKGGVESNQDTFKTDDVVGYHDLLKSYLNQRNIYNIENQMLKDKSNFSDSKLKQLSNLYDETIKQKQSSLLAYQTIFNDIKVGKSYPSNAAYGYVYDGYNSELKNSDDSNAKLAVKESYLKDLQQQIDSLNDEVKSTQSQKDSLKDFNDTNYNIDSNKNKMDTLQNDQLKSISGDLVKSNEQAKEIDTNIKELNEIGKSSYIKAKQSGVIHMNNQTLKGAKYVGAGSEIAEIYPVLQRHNTIKLQSYVSSKDISSIKRGQHMRLEITRNVPRPIIIDGKINNISVAPVPINKGTYYVITASAKNDNNIASEIHYGMSGKTNIITGKESFFRYYRDKLLNKN